MAASLAVLGILKDVFMQHAPIEQPGHAPELAQLPAILKPNELADGLRVPVDMLPKLVAAGIIPPPMFTFQRTKRWSRNAVIAALVTGGAAV